VLQPFVLTTFQVNMTWQVGATFLNDIINIVTLHNHINFKVQLMALQLLQETFKIT
jgi:hypothetical protein